MGKRTDGRAEATRPQARETPVRAVPPKRDEIIGEYEQVTDAQAEKLYKDGTTISPEARDWVRDFLAKTYQVKFD